MAEGAAFVYKWTDQDVESLIKLRVKHNAVFSGWRNAALHGWDSNRGPPELPLDHQEQRQLLPSVP